VGNGVGSQVSQAKLKVYNPQELVVSGGVFDHLAPSSEMAILFEESRKTQ